MNIVTALPKTTPISIIRRHPLVSFFALAFLYSWICRVPAMILPGWPEVISFLSLLGPAFAALTVWLICGDQPRITEMFRSLFRWKVNLGWYLVAFFLPLVLLAGTFLVNQIWRGAPLPGSGSSSPALLPFITLVLFNFVYLVFLEWGEEIGWRGFALPRLQEKLHPLAASAVLGLLWGAWHLPNFWIAGSMQRMVPIPVYLLYILGHTFLYSWIYNGTKGSLLLSCIHHAATNAFLVGFAAFPIIAVVIEPPITMLLVTGVLVVLVVLATRRTLLAERLKS